MRTDLRSCPFCGGDDVVHDASHVRAWVSCQSCGTQGPPVGGGAIADQEDAATAWNTRRRVPALPTPSQEGQP